MNKSIFYFYHKFLLKKKKIFQLNFIDYNQLCGNVRSWKRIIDSTGKKKDFGICEFEGFEVLFRALRVIGGEANKELGKDENAGTIELPRDDEDVTMQHITVNYIIIIIFIINIILFIVNLYPYIF